MVWSAGGGTDAAAPLVVWSTWTPGGARTARGGAPPPDIYICMDIDS